MNNIVLATALAVEPERVPCPRCGARGWLSAFKLEADGRWWPIAQDCPRCKGAKVLLRDGTPIEGRRTKESETMSENDLRAALTEVAEAEPYAGCEIRSVCLCCGKHLAGPTDAPPGRTSHGLCLKCFGRMRGEIDEHPA